MSAPSMGTGAILAVDFGGTKAAVAAFDDSGALRGRDVIDARAALGAEQLVDRTLDAAEALLARAAQGLPLRAVGVASPGVVRPEGVLLSPNLPGWAELRLAERFERRLGVRIDCMNDTKAAALAEAVWGHLAGADPGLHLNLGTGVAAAVVVGGAVLGGAHGTAGEIGYDLLSPTDACGPHLGRAPLEERAGGRALGEAGVAFGGAGDARSLLALARAGGPARAHVDAALRDLAVHVVNAALLVDPARITVGGGLTGAADLVLPVLAGYLDRATPFPPELRVARFATDGPLVGAAALAFTGLGLAHVRLAPP